MDASPLSSILALEAGSLFLLIATFASWFWLRETRSGDVGCMVVATGCAACLYLSTRMLGPEGCLGGIFGLPGLGVYLWFLALWSARRSEIGIRQWGRRHGYQVVTLERQATRSRTSPLGSGPDYRILARRLSDGAVLVGEVFLGGPGLTVRWHPVPTRHLPHGHRPGVAPSSPAAGSVPPPSDRIPPNAPPPPAV